jgi:hypothetical protein
MTTTTTDTGTARTELDRYLDALAAELDDLPPDERTALLDDLREHLAEVAADNGGSLATLPPAVEYAAEMRAAAGLAPPRRRRYTPSIPASVRRARDTKLWRETVAFLPQLRPAWWVLRGYIVAVAVSYALTGELHRGFPYLDGQLAVALVLLVLAVYASVLVGQRTRSAPRVRGIVIAANLAIAVVGLRAAAELHEVQYFYVDTAAGSTFEPVGPMQNPNGEDITNLYAYDTSGRLLRDVLLYDQAGRPVTVPHAPGGDLASQCPVDRNGAPVANAYPLTQRQRTWDPVTGAERWTRVRPPAVTPPVLGGPTTTTTDAPARRATADRAVALVPCDLAP